MEKTKKVIVESEKDEFEMGYQQGYIEATHDIVSAYIKNSEYPTVEGIAAIMGISIPSKGETK